ncbi:plastocyanin [Methanoculleus sp. Wushi-C6]|uniref:Plastocyanin n=1 Tax=Methanoculleus caldifontis TaxID=2651577 RepID=A0ABU3X334_9EURY|nr:PQQ-dependent sugar dehydrogenase [Methanoculleus sp. Wushi-C6]MDV2482468.1 plastocyanin [Methanoculleus sp. Wushi-C6]
MTNITPVIASLLLVLALVVGAGAQVVGSSNLSDINESSNQTIEGMENMSGNATDLTNAESPLAAILENGTPLTNLTVSNVTAEIGLELVAGNFTAPLAVAAPDDGTGRIFVVDQIGVVNVVDANGTTLPEPFLDLREEMVELRPTYDERGLLGFTFHPNFSENGKVYAFYSAPLREEAAEDWNCTNHISEFEVDPQDPNRVNVTSEKVLMYIDKPYHNHNGGPIAFGPADGYLYVALGDAGRANDVGIAHTTGIGNGQDLTKIYGKILRIDVDNVTDGNVTAPQNVTPMGNQTDDAAVNLTENPPEPTWTTFAGSLYGIPDDNPFAENQTEILDAYAYDSVPPEIYAYGLRNPAYMSFDSGGNNALFVADAGQNLFEEVDVIYAGGNYGWNIREGTHCFDPDNPTEPPESCNVTGYLGEPLIGPIFEGGRDLGIVVVGGNVYRGTAVPELEGSYVFGYWSDSRTVGNGTLLVATPPEGWAEGELPQSAGNLTAEQNAMWETRTVNITGQENLGMFLRGFGEDADGELYVLTNDVGGPDNTTSTGRVWKIVAPAAAGPTPTPTGNVTPAPTMNVTPVPTGNVTPPATANVTPTPTPTAGAAVTVNVTADDMAFDTDAITVPAGANVTMVFENLDDGIPHNVAVYMDSSASEEIFVGEVITGPDEVTYTFTAPSEAGTYYFRCDVHPSMNGDFIVE